MSLFDLFKPKRPLTPAMMAALSHRRTPESRRLTASKAYQALSRPARELVKAVLLDHLPPFEACRAIPNGTRLFDSSAVQRCLLEAGWEANPPIRPKNEPKPAPIESATCDTPKLPRFDMSDRQTPERTSAPPKPPQAEICEVCGQPSSGSYFGRSLCPKHGAAAAVGMTVTEAAPAATAPDPTAFPDRDGRCRSCQLVICNCGRRDYSPPPAEVILGQNGPVDASDLFPYLSDDNKQIWREQALQEQADTDALYNRFVNERTRLK